MRKPSFCQAPRCDLKYGHSGPCNNIKKAKVIKMSEFRWRNHPVHGKPGGSAA